MKLKVALSASMIQEGKSGVAQYIFGLLDGLALSKENLDLIVYGFLSERHLFDRWLDWCHWREIPSRFRSPVLNLAWHQVALPRRLRQEKIQVLHIPSYRRMVYRSPCPQLVTIHDCAAFSVKGKYDWARMIFGRYLVPWLALQVDQIVTVSQTTARDVSHYFKIPRELLKVIYNGIDHQRFCVPTEKELKIWKSSQTKLKSNLPYFIYIARLEHPAKNHVALIEAFERFKEKTKLPHLLVFGGADWHGASVIYDRIHRSKWRDSILNLGFVEAASLRFWYAGAIAMVYPSLFEGFGFPPIEAMACGCPVICSDRGSLLEITGEACFRIDPENISGILMAMDKIASDPKIREVLSIKGLAWAKSFCWKVTADAILNLYSELACKTKDSKLINQPSQTREMNRQPLKVENQTKNLVGDQQSAK